MPKFECTYCGERFELGTWSDKKCPICKDKKLRRLPEEVANTDVFGYNYKTKDEE